MPLLRRRRRRRPRQKRRRRRWSPTVERSWNASFPNSTRALLFFSALVGRADLLIFGRCGKMVCKSRGTDVAPRREGFLLVSSGCGCALCGCRNGFGFFVLWWFCLFLGRVGSILFVPRRGKGFSCTGNRYIPDVNSLAHLRALGACGCWRSGRGRPPVGASPRTESL